MTALSEDVSAELRRTVAELAREPHA